MKRSLITYLTIIKMITTIVATAVGIYEVLSRVVKTTKTWSLIGNILKVLTYISDLFDNKTKSK